MGVFELLKWQWSGYSRYHRSRANLLLHIAVVPLFLAGNAGLVASLAERSWFWGLTSLAAMVVSVALQGRGHRQEENPPEPFTSAANAVCRIFLEQWITFPRFVVSGGWLRAWRQGSPERTEPGDFKKLKG
ncbi:hypothetical protein [Polaromonas sp. JS666]|uniref:hypothetical protein n=1 Tax=Polaromonas sp. (strain JS666 / ATCC BAA-500) TaxID=296591 RepID=UPI0000533DA2|nr:hypothetical protein [Polaromonas sp. JS666]ABE46650.1 conserved hypothetical protein [Polaromonas sp. JS666]